MGWMVTVNEKKQAWDGPTFVLTVSCRINDGGHLHGPISIEIHTHTHGPISGGRPWCPTDPEQ